MINLIDHSSTNKSNLTFTDFFPNQDFNLILLTHNLEESEFLNRINFHILERLMNLNLEDVPKKDLEKTLKEFFIEINWQLYSRFRNTQTMEFGISLMLLIILNDEIFLVQFGRMLCGKIKTGELEHIGNDWKNLAVKSKSELSLLGAKDENIVTKIHKFKLENGEIFFSIPSLKVEELKKLGINSLSIKENINTLYNAEKFPFCIINSGNIKELKKRGWFRNIRTRIIAVIMSLIIILSVIYVFYGKNWFADQQHLLKQKNREFRQNELMDTFLKLQEQGQETLNEIFKQNLELEIFPHQKIEMQKIWTQNIPFFPTLKPFFDYKMIYLVSDHKILSLKKKTQKKCWEKSIENKIVNLELLDANRLLLILENQEILCLNRDSGDMIWTKKCDLEISKSKESKSAFQISLDKYKRLGSSIILLHSKETVTLLNTIEGDSIFTYKSDTKIDLISDFDLLEKCIYIIENKRISKIAIEVLS